MNRNSKKTPLSETERTRLLKAIEPHKVIWDKACPEYNNRHILLSAWAQISQQLNMTVEDCKIGWKSIRDRRRYYAAKHKKQNGVCEIPDGDSFFISEVFEVPDDMTLPAEEQSNDDCHFVDMEMRAFPVLKREEFIEAESNYSYNSTNSASKDCTKPDSRARTTSDSNENFATRDNSFKRLRAELWEPPAMSTQPKLKYQPLFAHLDFIMSQLPASIANDLGAKFTAMAYEELKKHDP